VPSKLHAFWYSPLLPLLFYVSAIAIGMAMTIFESWHSSKAMGRALELPLLASLGRVLAVTMSVYLWIRFIDLGHRDALRLLSQNRMETWLFALEIALILVPTVLLYWRKIRLNPHALYFCAVSLVFGFVANRLNVATTGLEASAGVRYIPKWSEISITLSIIAVGFATFRAVAGFFPIFEEEHGHSPEARAIECREHEPEEMAVVR
jgi:Ni/Fe-hydrogenase subunit HybB-like protein